MAAEQHIRKIPQLRNTNPKVSEKGCQEPQQFPKHTTLVDVSDIFYFFLSGAGGEGGGVRGGGRGSGFLLKVKGGGGGFRGGCAGGEARGRAPGGMSVGRGGGAKYFFSGPKFPKHTTKVQRGIPQHRKNAIFTDMPIGWPSDAQSGRSEKFLVRRLQGCPQE